MINWGSVPDWLAGLGSTLALLFAFLAVRSANAQLRIIENDRRQAQAQGIGVWLSQDESGSYHYNLINTSQLPVHSVITWVRRIGDAEEKGTMHQLQWLAPGGMRIAVEHPEWIREHDLFVEIMFRDSATQHWRRDRTGKLISLRRDEFRHYAAQLDERRTFESTNPLAS